MLPRYGRNVWLDVALGRFVDSKFSSLETSNIQFQIYEEFVVYVLEMSSSLSVFPTA